MEDKIKNILSEIYYLGWDDGQMEVRNFPYDFIKQKIIEIKNLTPVK